MLKRLIQKITCKLFSPLVFLNCDPLFDKVLGFRTDFKVQRLIENSNVFKETSNSEDFLACLKFKMAKRHQAASVVYCSFIIFDGAKLIEQFLHKLVSAFLRYIVDKHFLPDFVFGAH